jgi:hypothetical protein
MRVPVLFLAALVAGPLAAAPGKAPMALTKTRHIAIPVKINGAGPFRVILDTGSPITFFSNKVAVQAHLITPETAAKPSLMGIRGQVVAQTVDVGGVVIKDMPVMVLDHPTIAQINQVDPPIDGIVGLSFFGRYKVALDYSRGEVLLEPGTFQPSDVTSGLAQKLFNRQAAGPKVVAPGALWGLKVEKADENGGVRITEVAAGSAAEAAGLKVGDRLMTLDGRWTDSVQECWDAAALVKPGQAATVKVFRDGREMELEVKPRLGL